MIDASFLSWPFFEERHRRFASELDAWAKRQLQPLVDHHDGEASCRRLMRHMGEEGWLKAVVPEAYGGLSSSFDVRILCLARETLASHDGFAGLA